MADKIKRYDPLLVSVEGAPKAFMKLADGGEYILYTDHQAAMREASPCWSDGYPELSIVDDTPVRDPNKPGAWLPPTVSSQYVLVELDDGTGVAIDRAIATGKGRAAWYIYGKRVCGWMPIPKTRRASAHQECGGGGE